MAHLGVIKCLEEENIKPDLIVGTSIGALIGGLLAFGYGFEKLTEKSEEIVASKEFEKLGFEFFKEHKKGFPLKRLGHYLRGRLTFAKMAVAPYITKRETLRDVVDKFIPEVNIEDLKIKFGCTALDIVSGRDLYIEKGPLKEAIMKSISIAGIFPPWEDENKVLVDAGPTAKVPVDGCRHLGANKIIAVNVGSKLSKYEEINSGLFLNYRVDEIAKFRYNKLQAEKAEVLIQPEVESIHWCDFSKIDYGIKSGYTATKEKLPEIKKLLKPSLLSRIKKTFSIFPTSNQQ